MRIVILGAGGVGGYFGSRLVAGGADVTFLVRPGRAARLQKDGLTVLSSLGDLRQHVKTAEQIDRPHDLILLACKAYDLEAAVQAIAPAVGEGTIVIPLLNGIRHLDVLDRRYPTAHILGGLCHIGVTLTPDGNIQHLNKLQHLAFGARSPAQQAASQTAHAALDCGGLSPVLSQSIMQDMWEKFVFLASYASVTCVMRSAIGAIASTPHGASITTELFEECAAVAAASGFPPRSQFIAESLKTLTDKTSAGTSSMLRDLQRNAKTEHEHIIGDMLARGRSLDVPTPLLQAAATVLRVYETNLPNSAA